MAGGVDAEKAPAADVEVEVEVEVEFGGIGTIGGGTGAGSHSRNKNPPRKGWPLLLMALAAAAASVVAPLFLELAPSSPAVEVIVDGGADTVTSRRVTAPRRSGGGVAMLTCALALFEKQLQQK